MLVLDGMPGAGKTSALGAVLTQNPGAVVFPEAQPPEHGDDDAVMRYLLAEDNARTQQAQHLRRHDPHRQVASDRCHLGVLAYRYALARLSGSWADFERALGHSRDLALDARHYDDTVVILQLTPSESVRNRRHHAGDRRYRTWYDQDFLAFYGEFFDELARWVTPGPRWRHQHATDPALRGFLPAAPAPRSVVDVELHCGRDCGSPRSATVTTGQDAVQLWSRGLHHRRGDRVRCLRSATAITAPGGPAR